MDGAAATTFVAASLLLAVTPGPGVVYIVTRTLAQGRAAGLSSVAGVACGNFLNAGGASLGLAALFAVSHTAFLIVKFAGAAYLIWLGVRMWAESGAPGEANSADAVRVPRRRLWRDGLLVALLNPKTAIFFAAFLPQFMDHAAPASGAALGQALLIGSAFVAIAACTDAAYALLAAALSARLAALTGAARVGRRAGGTSLIVLGLLSGLGAHAAEKVGCNGRERAPLRPGFSLHTAGMRLQSGPNRDPLAPVSLRPFLPRRLLGAPLRQPS